VRTGTAGERKTAGFRDGLREKVKSRDQSKQHARIIKKIGKHSKKVRTKKNMGPSGVMNIISKG